MHEFKNEIVHAAAPDTVTYNKGIGSYTRVTNKVSKDAPLKGEKVLRYIINLRNNGNPLIAPDHMSYNNLISA